MKDQTPIKSGEYPGIGIGVSQWHHPSLQEAIHLFLEILSLPQLHTKPHYKLQKEESVQYIGHVHEHGMQL